jgi:hypothetical protein
MTGDRLTLRLPKPLRDGIEALSDSTGRTESDLAREAIAEYLDKRGSLPTCLDLAREAGMVGCIRSGHGDLSTNPRHMEGFGQ